MRLRPVVSLFLALSAGAMAQKPKAKPVAPAVPAVPAKPSQLARPAKPSTLIGAPPQIISSELGGRDLGFVAEATELCDALSFLSDQTARTSSPDLKQFGENLQKTLVAHTAVLDTLAEMRDYRRPTTYPATVRLAQKLVGLEGLKFEKGILNGFIEIEERMVVLYQTGRNSQDATIFKFVEQGLPQAEQHLESVQRMAGIAPSRSPVTRETPPASEASTPPPSPKTPEEPTVKTTPPVKEPPKEPVKPAKPIGPDENTALAAIPPEIPPEIPPKEKPILRAPKPESIAEPPAEDVAPKQLEGAAAKPPKRPSFRTNVKPPE